MKKSCPVPSKPRTVRASPGGDSPASQAQALATLTPREREVLGWLTEAKRDAEIASILGISVFTVRKHVSNLFHKLQVENRTAAARLAIEAGRPIEYPTLARQGHEDTKQS